MSTIVVIGNFTRAFSFPDRATAVRWAETAEFTSLTNNGRTSTTIMDVADGAPFAFRVTVTITPAGPDGLDNQFEDAFVATGYTFEEAEAAGLEAARAKYAERSPGATFYADTRVRS